MSKVFIPLYDYDPSVKEWRKFAWVGPEETLTPEPRRSVSTKCKREILNRQKGLCRFCGSRISLEPYCNADADHIIPVNYGGKTNEDNIQLLCVGCHRHKTSLENSKEKRLVYFPSNKSLNPRETLIVYSSTPDIVRPADMKNPVNIPREPSDGGYVLSYKKRRRGVYIDHDHGDHESQNIFDKFRYIEKKMLVR